jgi:hypothetical protein
MLSLVSGLNQVRHVLSIQKDDTLLLKPISQLRKELGELLDKTREERSDCYILEDKRFLDGEIKIIEIMLKELR